MAPLEGLWGATEESLSRALDAAALRQRVVAHNLANLETPGYRRFQVVFEELLAQQQSRQSRLRLSLATTHPAHLKGIPARPAGPVVVQDEGTIYRNDANNVDPERELATMAKNGLWYRSLSRAMSSRFASLRTAIHEGRR